MTDDHGPDSPPVHEEIPEHEHQAETPDAGVWSDDHPPVDDFADAGASVEETASASHEAASDVDDGSMPAQPPSRSMLPLFAGIGGILLLGAVIYWQFGHSSPPPPMTAPVAAPKSSSSMAGVSNSKSSAPMPKKVEESDINALYKGAPESGEMPSAPAAPTTAMAPPEAAVPPAPAMPAAPAPVPMAPPPAAPAATVESRIASLASRFDTLEKLVQGETQQIAQLSNMVAATQAMPPASSQVSPALEDRLNKIEQSLMQLEHNQAAKAPAVTMPAEVSAETAAEAPAKTVTHHTHATKTKHKTKKTVKSVAHNSSSMMAATPMAGRPSSQWVLRAATPTEAWVSSDSHSAELRHVQVGDTLSGIGQIRSIRQTPSGWEIEGTTGTIR